MALVKHSELSVQQIAHIQRHLVAMLNKDTFWDKFCSHGASAPEGTDSYEWRKLNYKHLTAADIVNLQEGITPAGKKLEYVSFKVTPEDYGNWIGYTDKSKKYNYDDVVKDAKTVLGMDAHEQAEFRKAKQYVSGKCTITVDTGTNGFLKTLLKAKTILKRNGIKPISGNRYGCILTSEQAASVLLDYAAQITHTSQKEALIDGYLGELGGFILYETTHEAMYTVSGETTKGYCLFFGKSAYGMPVQTVPFGKDSVEVYDNGLGSIPQYDETNGMRPDALHQRGSVGYKRMGFATRIVADEAVLRGEVTLTAKDVLEVADANRSHYVAKSTSPSV